MEKTKIFLCIVWLYSIVALVLFGLLGAGVWSVVGIVALIAGSVFIGALIVGWFDTHWYTKQ